MHGNSDVMEMAYLRPSDFGPLFDFDEGDSTMVVLCVRKRGRKFDPFALKPITLRLPHQVYYDDIRKMLTRFGAGSAMYVLGLKSNWYTVAGMDKARGLGVSTGPVVQKTKMTGKGLAYDIPHAKEDIAVVCARLERYTYQPTPLKILPIDGVLVKDVNRLRYGRSPWAGFEKTDEVEVLVAKSKWWKVDAAKAPATMLVAA